MPKYTIGYNVTTHCETEQFKAKDVKAAIKLAKEVLGQDITIEHVVEDSGKKKPIWHRYYKGGHNS